MVMLSIPMRSHQRYLAPDSKIMTIDLVIEEPYLLYSEHVVFRDEVLKKGSQGIRV